MELFAKGDSYIINELSQNWSILKIKYQFYSLLLESLCMSLQI
jgi:hypothetical protein